MVVQAKPSEHDSGVDGHLEVVLQDGTVTGQMLAVQIKYGKSFLQEKNRWGYKYRGELKHFNYLANYPIPVVLIICHPETENCYWIHFQPEHAQETDAGWNLTIPTENKLLTTKSSIEALLQPLVDSLAGLEEYWATNTIVVESSHIHFIIDRKEVDTQDTARPRAFFDRLRTTKELAYQCQGKLEISFHGYASDLRELFEIEEVRGYIQLLDCVLPELFFFARTDMPTDTLRTFAFCQTKVELPDGRSTKFVTHQLVYKTDKVGLFLERHWSGLNEMTDWLAMPVEENKRITNAVVRRLGVKMPGDEYDA